MSDFVSKSGKTYACSLSTQCPATETFVLYIHFKDQNTQAKENPDLPLTGIQSQLITHTSTPDKRQGKRCDLFPPCCQCL